MPLVDLKTDLTSLKFGGDRPGGGSSTQPFVQGKSLDKRIAEDGIETLGRTGGPDMFIRGGFQVATSVENDLKRLGKYFSTVKGGLFVAQQNTLSALGTRIYGGYPTSITGPNSFRLNDGVYTPLSTLSSAIGNPIGGHPNKQGTDPTGLSILGRPEYVKLLKGNDDNFITLDNSIRSNNRNRLVNLYNEKITSAVGSTSTELFRYKGGPNKGAKTIIKTASDRTFFSGYDNRINLSNFLDPARRYSTFSQEQLQNYNVVGDKTSTRVQDFRKNLLFKPKSNISDSPDYRFKNIEQRVNLGDPGKRGVDRSNYSKGITSVTGKAEPLDKINSLYLYKSSAVTQDGRKNDLVKFRIATIDNDDPSKAVFAHFRAFINSFTDSMGAEWNSFKYTGRGENFYTYQGFNNTVNMSFTVAMQSIQELSIAYQKLNYLKSTLAPSYSDNGYMRGNIHRLTIGGYFYETPGIIDSLTYTIPQESPWEIGITTGGGFNSSVKELPHIINVDMTFKPIYKFLPETVKHIDAAGAITQRFISLENDGEANTLYDIFPDNTYRANDHKKDEPEIIPAPPSSPTQADLDAFDEEMRRLDNLERG